MEEAKSLYELDGDIVNNWYIICLTRELSKKPIARKIYEKQYVIYRDQDQKPVVMLDRCLHRHTLLSMGGEVVDGNIQCPYHGWQYNSQGEVISIPSEGHTPPKRKLCLKTLPAYEQDGAIWVWMGEEPPRTKTPPWRFPYSSENDKSQGWVSYFMITEFDNNVTNLAENFMDVPHTVYVHKGWFRDKEDKQIPMKVETKDGTVLVTYEQKSDRFSFVARNLLNPKNEEMTHTDQYIFPNLTRVDYWFGNRNGFIINSQMTPISPLETRVYTYIAYKMEYLGNLLKPFVQFYTRQVIEQDVDIMHNQGTSLRIDPKTSFQSTPADEVHICIERLRHFGKKADSRLKVFESEKDVCFWV